MPMQNETPPVDKTVPAQARAEHATGEHGEAHPHHQHHDIGEEIAGLDEHWVFRKDS